MTKQGLSLDGWLRWQLLEGRRVVREGEQHNLFLNQGLDLLAQFSLASIGNYAAVGTGPTVPDVAQTALAAEIARTQSNPNSVPVGPTLLANGKHRFTFEREFTETQANGNLAEWGVAAGPTGNLAVRELFRDGSGNTTVIPKTSGQKLRLTYYLDVTLSPVVLTAGAFNVPNLGNFPGKYMLHRSNNGRVPADVYVAINAMTAGALGVSLLPAGFAQAYNLSNQSAVGAVNVGAVGPYVTGTYKRKVSASFTTAQSNVAFAGYAVSYEASNMTGSEGYTFVFDGGATATKDNAHSLGFDCFEFTWGRG